jgi:hypothetical protein
VRFRVGDRDGPQLDAPGFDDDHRLCLNGHTSLLYRWRSLSATAAPSPTHRDNRRRRPRC